MDVGHSQRSTYRAISPGCGVFAEEDTEDARRSTTLGLARGRGLRTTGYLAVVLLVSAGGAVVWLGGARRGRTVASLRSRVGLEEHEECRDYEENVDYRGLRELRQVEKITSSRKCSELCLEAKGCVAWTWGKLRNVFGFSDVCFLKELVEGEKAQKFTRYGVVAGVRSGTPCSAATEEIPSSVSGHIQVHGGFCLEAVAPAFAGSDVAMVSCDDDSTGQDWTYVEKTGRVKNGHGLCLDAVDKSKPFVRLQMYPCDSGNWSQQWMFDEETGLLKNWRGSCVEAGETNIDGGQVYMQTCDVSSAGQRWRTGASGDQPPQHFYDPGTLYCFALMLPGSYEQDLLAMQHQKRVSLFACEEYAVYSNQVIQIDGDLTSGVVNSDLKCGKGGEFGTALNLDIFIAVWTKVVSDARYAHHDWTCKVDPDAVFFPMRLKHILRIHPESKAGVYLNNCKFGMHGPVEVFSRNAVTAWAMGSPRCVEHFQKKCGGDCFWGEDLFVDQCLWKVLDVRRDNDFRLLLEDHCEPPENWDSCTDGSKVTFHPFKSVKGYEECLENAGKPPPPTPRPTAPPIVVTVSAPRPTEKPSAPSVRGDEEEHSRPAREAEKPGDSDELEDDAARERSRSRSSDSGECHTAEKDERCYIAVKWAMDYGIRLHPDWYDGLSQDSSWYDFQATLHGRPHIPCPMPCKGEAEKKDFYHAIPVMTREEERAAKEEKEEEEKGEKEEKEEKEEKDEEEEDDAEKED